MPGHQQADGNHDRSGGIEREHRLGGRDTDKRTYPVNTDYVNDNLGAKSSTDPDDDLTSASGSSPGYASTDVLRL